MAPRRATHAGSWYSSSKSELDQELSGWLADVDRADFPRKGCRAIIAPHAGYSYSGPCAAWAYGAIDVAAVKRIFILGPSHHAYLDGCAVTACTEYATPLGSLSVDQDVSAELRKTGKFTTMTQSVDEDEHSIEMHLPYIRKIFAGRDDITIVPILVGSISLDRERMYGALLAPYLADPSTVFIVSSDFCHWGSRFNYTFYYPPGVNVPCIPKLTRDSQVDKAQPIHASIAKLDREAMDQLEFSPAVGKKAKTAHEEFAAYLARTRNTICGRHPIGVLLGALSSLEEGAKLEFTRYERSSLVEGVRESSVSYVSGFVEM